MPRSRNDDTVPAAGTREGRASGRCVTQASCTAARGRVVSAAEPKSPCAPTFKPSRSSPSSALRRPAVRPARTRNKPFPPRARALPARVARRVRAVPAARAAPVPAAAALARQARPVGRAGSLQVVPRRAALRPAVWVRAALLRAVLARQAQLTLEQRAAPWRARPAPAEARDSCAESAARVGARLLLVHLHGDETAGAGDLHDDLAGRRDHSDRPLVAARFFPDHGSNAAIGVNGEHGRHTR
jgi:hypothetical protein